MNELPVGLCPIPKQDPALTPGSWVLSSASVSSSVTWGQEAQPTCPQLCPYPTSPPCRRTDFNNDGYICAWDLEQTVTKLTRGELSAEEVSLVCEKVLDEADGDHDGRLSLEDFQNMILRAPDFLRCATPRHFAQSMSSSERGCYGTSSQTPFVEVPPFIRDLREFSQPPWLQSLHL